MTSEAVISSANFHIMEESLRKETGRGQVAYLEEHQLGPLTTELEKQLSSNFTLSNLLRKNSVIQITTHGLTLRLYSLAIERVYRPGQMLFCNQERQSLQMSQCHLLLLTNSGT